MMSAIPKVAIACQGGGSHAAFAAGVLLDLLRPAQWQRFELVALSGTSGGAMCAALTWAGLLVSPEDAHRRLSAFWRDVEARDLGDAVANFWSVWLARLQVIAEVSPYVYAPLAERRLTELLFEHLALEKIEADQSERDRVKLYIGATDVLSGERKIFEKETLGYDALIASAAVPPIFRAVNIDGVPYWDGVFTTNPPVREFTNLDPRPDEIWIVQINPQRRAREPKTMQDIVDRRNELSGNLSLLQELAFIQKVNELLAEHGDLQRRYAPIKIRVVPLGEDLDYPSKLDRNRTLIERLLKSGEARAEWFFDSRSDWPTSAKSSLR